MYEYQIAVPAEHADEVENVLRDHAEIRPEGIMRAPRYIAADEAVAIATGDPLMILTLRSTSLENVTVLKNWVEQRFGDPYVDVWIPDAAGVLNWDLRSHNAEETKDHVRKLSALPPSARGKPF
ncbi:MAG: hypothetical protein M1380_04520 [Chloroflexi bacterium]|nr:hypothetical protein [Chloroflexota bacterium]